MYKPIVYLLVLLLPGGFFSCGKTGNPPVYHFYDSITVDGLQRSYLVNLPPNYGQDGNFPLVIALHGLAGSAAQMEHDYGLTDKSNSAGFMIVYPEGVRSDGPLGIRTWNAGSCCDYAMQQNIDDVKFIRLLLDKLLINYRIDRKRVYVTGMSNGAMLTYRLACEMADRIAAIAPVSGTLMTTQPCTPCRSMPIMHIHSALDTKVPYYGGIGLDGYYFHPVDSALSVWAAIDHCNPKATGVIDTTLYSMIQYNFCSPNTTIQRYLTKDGGHSWPGSLQPRPGADAPSAAFNATDMIWDFLKQYALP